MDDDASSDFRSRCSTWPLKRLLTEDPHAQPPEPFQIQYYEDSNHSVQSYHNATDSPLLTVGPTAFPPAECWTSESFGFPPVQTSSYSFQQPSTSTLNDTSVWTNEAKEEEDTVGWNSKFCRQSHDSTSQRKMNPWGEESYADLITRALEEAPNNRLKLNEIYQWFSDNVLYFQERSSPEASSGWKVPKLIKF